MKKKLKVGVVFGGPSSEHDISVMSGKNILQHLDRDKYIPTSIKIPKKGSWVIPFIIKAKKVDLIFLALHGQFGEDGKIQAILDSLHIPYTGSGVQASSIGMDKTMTYKILSQEGMQFPKSQLVNSKKETISTTFPCVVKPNASGSSVGVSIVKTKKDLSKALSLAFKEGAEVIVEDYITGREFSCAVLGSSDKRVIPLPVGEIKTARQFFDYKAKYFDSGTQEICPVDIPKQLEKQIQKQAVVAHKGLGCEGLTRSDFIVQGKRIYFLEINTTPGQTKESLAPKMAKAMGWSLEEFFEKQIKLAMQKLNNP